MAISSFQKLLAAAVVCGAALVTPTTTSAQDAAPRNAALHYWRVWQEIPEDLSQAAGESYKNSDPEWRPDEALTKLLTANQGFIGSVLKATRIDECDFNVAYDEGFMALLPHLGIMRKTTRILGADARRLTAAGDGAGAAKRIRAIFRLASHTRSDKILISSLVGMAIFSTAMGEVDVLSKTGGLTEDGRTILLGELSRLNPTDPFATREALETEREIMLGYVKRHCTGPEAGKQFAQLISGFDSKVNNEELVQMDEAALHRAVDRASDFYRAAESVWDEPDAAEQLQKLIKSLEAGEFGPVAKEIAPSIGKCHASCVRSKASLAVTINLLKGTVPAEAPHAK